MHFLEDDFFWVFKQSRCVVHLKFGTRHSGFEVCPTEKSISSKDRKELRGLSMNWHLMKVCCTTKVRVVFNSKLYQQFCFSCCFPFFLSPFSIFIMLSGNLVKFEQEKKKICGVAVYCKFMWQEIQKPGDKPATSAGFWIADVGLSLTNHQDNWYLVSPPVVLSFHHFPCFTSATFLYPPPTNHPKMNKVSE